MMQSVCPDLGVRDDDGDDDVDIDEDDDDDDGCIER